MLRYNSAIMDLHALDEGKHDDGAKRPTAVPTAEEAWWFPYFGVEEFFGSCSSAFQALLG